MIRTIISCCLLCMLGTGAVVADEALRVFVSIPPQQYLVKRIGGNHVNVRVMLEPGNAPETFDPTLRQITALNSARLYFRIGVAFENKWLENVRRNNRDIRIVDCCEGLTAIHSIALDNHVWTSVRNAGRLAGVIRQTLVEVDPAHAPQYEQNYTKLMADLARLDSEIAALIGQRRTDYFIISHESLGHFARDYGLVQLSLEKNGKALGASSLVGLIEQARARDIHNLIIQKHHFTAAAVAFANEIGAELIEIDILASDYIAVLRETAAAIARATR